MLDRIDIHIEVLRMNFKKLSDNRWGESSDDILARAEKVRQICELDAGQTLIKATMT